MDRIGIDFDNTIVCYDELFHTLALERGFVPRDLPATKHDVRQHMRARGQEAEWIELQGLAYGLRIVDAPAFSGVLDFLNACRETGTAVRIISHKTQLPYRGPRYLNLHLAAWSWLSHHGLLDGHRTVIKPADVYFEPTKQHKLARIAERGCSWFVDDLPEFLGDPAFPPNVQRVLFDPTDHHTQEGRFLRVRSWFQMSGLVFQQVNAG